MTNVYYDECAKFTQATWNYLNTGITVTNSATSACNQITICDSITSVATAATSYTQAVWHVWHTQHATEEEVRAHARTRKTEEQRMRETWEAQKREQEIARGKAKALLVEHLSARQRATYEEKRYFDVELEGKTYRIHQGTHGNVRLLGPQGEAVRYCAQPDGVPAEDAMLAQKLMLETDEAAFLKVANASPLIVPAYR